MAKQSPKQSAQRSISRGISICSELINQPHQDILVLEAGKRLLFHLATAGESLNNIIEDQEDVGNVLERICDKSKDESEQISNLLLSIQDYHLIKLSELAALSTAMGEISKQVMIEVYNTEHVDTEQVKVSIGKAILALAALGREHDLKIIDCITSVIQFDED